MIHSEYQERLSEILSFYREYVTGVYQGSENYDEATAKQAITELFNEVVGEDEEGEDFHPGRGGRFPPST